MNIKRVEIIREKLNIKPTRGKNCYIAKNVTVVGDVHMGEHCTIMYGAVLRGDTDTLTLGNRTNIQDNAVVHADIGVPTTIGDDCTIGHSAIVHGATIGNNVLIGMHATILNHAQIGDDCIIGAQCLVPEGMKIPSGSLVVGIPARIIRVLDEEQKRRITQNASDYVDVGYVCQNHPDFQEK